jgi:hypothetical protein
VLLPLYTTVWIAIWGEYPNLLLRVKTPEVLQDPRDVTCIVKAIMSVTLELPPQALQSPPQAWTTLPHTVDLPEQHLEVYVRCEEP